MGFFSSLDQEKYDRQYSDRQLFIRMVEYFRPYLKRLISIALLLLLTSITAAFTPIIISQGINLLGDELQTQVILLLFLAILTTGLISWISNWVRRRLLVRVVGDVILTLRSDAFDATLDHDLSFFDDYSSGKIVSRITSDSQDFGNTIVLLTDLISQIIQSLILAIVLIRIDWKLALVVFCFLPFLFFVAISFRRIARTVTRAGMRAMANVNATIKETVSGILVAKNFRQEQSVYKVFDDANQQSYNVNVRRGVVLATVFPTLSILSGVATGALVYFGGLSAANAIVTTGAWFLFLQSLDRFFFPVLNLSSFWAQVQTGLSAAERIFALIDAEPRVIQINNYPPPLLKGEIEFINVNFQYSANEKVLENFSLRISPGETVALVGHTGAGKSSIAKLVSRFYEFQAGRILIDGLDIRDFNLRNYRSQLGIVSQVPFLFSGTVSENICYVCDPKSAKEDMNDFANKIGNGEWLGSLSNGLETQVGERGSRLSMGQRQLVALLRVLVQRPSIFILDEATASVDPFTESQIQDALSLIMKSTTSILIAHRLSTVKAADRIIVLDRGAIIEQGNHDELLKFNGHYADLYNTYFRHQSIDYKPAGINEFLLAKQSTHLPIHPD
jgi:ATP-binding cassette, subfamily B, bacterial